MTCSISGGCIANYGFLEQIKYNTIQYNTMYEEKQESIQILIGEPW
jgi:hypothetical protein